MLCILLFIPFVTFAGVFGEDNMDGPYQLQAAGSGSAFLWNTQTGDVWFIIVGGERNYQNKVTKYFAKHPIGFDQYGNIILPDESIKIIIEKISD